jgi:hypothetical protein
MSDQTDGKSDTTKTDDERKREAEAEANAAWRRAQYFRYVMSGGQVGPYDRDYGNWNQKFGRGRMIDWRRF